MGFIACPSRIPSSNRERRFGWRTPGALPGCAEALGVNAWVTRDFVVKMAIHEISGRRFMEAPATLNTAAPERTTLYEVGAQFGF